MPTPAKKKATPEQMIRGFVGNQSRQRIMWATAKKSAAKNVNTNLFKENLGRALDSFYDVCAAAKEISKVHGKLDQRTLKPLKDRKDRVLEIIGNYQQICQNQMDLPGVTPAQERSWESLSRDLTFRRDKVNEEYKNVKHL